LSDLEQSAAQEIVPDNVGNDVRAAIEELKVGSTEPKLDVVIDKGEVGRVRDEAGKFAKADAAPKRETLTLPEKDAGIKPDPTQQFGVAPPDPAAPPAPVEAPKPAVEPPKGWNAEEKAKWSEVPEWAQRAAARREDELTKKLFQHDEVRDFGRKLQDIANPYLPIMRAEGADIPRAFENYLQTSFALRQGTPMQKALALHAIAQQFNVDLSLPQQQGGVDPRYVQLERQIADLTQRLSGQDQERQQREEQTLQQQIAEFSTAPGHEHFEKVRARMGALLETGEAKDMEDAYQQAIWSHPEVRTSLMAAQTKSAEDQRIAEQKAKADAAKAAAVSVKGSPGGSRPLNGAISHGSIADDLRAAVAEVRGRV
jgi:hypothetical protein